ncbi:hypothetical protein CU098_012135 [Rhizopus stolonifer]|uniref:Major facilitator superfamily (MFS) profile domain-containing protein n=1 Tax=Rhizopus stolonifer TaxID=4846 RepID=A0A367KWW2_RHIST|nr:hypothetical protein CU098_012135 [Rhizopus stolonifer]
MSQNELNQVKRLESSDSKIYTSISNTAGDKTPPHYNQYFKTKKDMLNFGILMLGVAISMFMMSLNSTVIAPALGIIATELNAAQDQSWIATAYLVAVNTFQPLSGKFSVIFGSKLMFLFVIVLFFIGSLINALSTTISLLLIGRIVQGFGSGGIFSMVFIVVAEVTPVPLRPRFQSMLAVTYGVASVAGPLLGGAFVDHASWHWDFWLNLILASIAFAIIFFFAKPQPSTKDVKFMDKVKRIDFLGTLFATGVIVCLLLALAWGISFGWRDGHTIGAFVAFGISLIVLIIVEGWIAKEPILPGNILLNPACTIVYIYEALLGLVFICGVYFTPVYFQAVFGATSMESGVRLIPFMVCLIIGSLGGSFLIRAFPYTKYYAVVGASCNVLCYGLFYTVDENSNWGTQAGFLTFTGLAFGISNQSCILSVQSSVELKYIAVATTCVNFFLMFACSFGISIYETLTNTFVQAQYAQLPADIISRAKEYGALENYLYIRNMPVDLQRPVIQAFARAMRNLFLVPLVISVVGLVAALSFKNVRYGPPKSSKENEENEKLKSEETA